MDCCIAAKQNMGHSDYCPRSSRYNKNAVPPSKNPSLLREPKLPPCIDTILEEIIKNHQQSKK